MKNRIRSFDGFTLVELLIVIALIAILSVAVLATINPIEQSNKARDAAMKNDAAEVLGAYERYYASQNSYPWNQPNVADTTVVLSSQVGDFGVIGTSTAGVLTPLVSTSELKSSFSSKKPFVANPAPEDILYAYHNATTNSNYVCYFPKATASRTAGKAADLKCVDLTVGSQKIIDQSANCAPPAAGVAWSYTASATVANVACVPEGKVQ